MKSNACACNEPSCQLNYWQLFLTLTVLTGLKTKPLLLLLIMHSRCGFTRSALIVANHVRLFESETFYSFGWYVYYASWHEMDNSLGL